MKSRFVKVLAGLLLAFLVTAGAGLPASAGPGEVRIADGKGDWGYPNPYRHYPRGPGYIRMSWVFDTLVWKNQNGYVPALADSWSYDPASKSFTFKLNPKAKWHDGRSVTAEDVVFTINYFKEHPYRWVDLESVERAEALDKETAVIFLNQPYSPFLSDIAGGMPIMPKHVWEKVDKPKDFDDPAAYIGSGPYKFMDFNKAKGTYLYHAFEDYYQGRPKADRLIYIKAGNPIMTLSTSQADMCNIRPEMAAALKKKGFVVLADKYGWNKKLMINHQKPPFNDKRFRQALAYAIDQQEIVDKAHRGLGAPASYGLLSKDNDYYNPKTPAYPHDPAKARQILESLGYEKGADGFYAKDGQPLQVEILAANISVAGETAPDRDGEVIKRQLEAAGIKVDLVNMEQATTDSKVRNWDFDLAISGHGGLLGDPKILNEMISSKYGAGSVNSARFDGNAELLELLDAQLTEMDPDKRKAIVYRIQEVYAEEMPAISLHYPDSMCAYNPEKGIVWFYTKGGIGKGIPIAQNKLSLIK